MKIHNRFKYIIFCTAIIFIFSCNVYAITEKQIASEAAICVERSTGRVLFSKNISEKRKIASTTKIMTAIITMENCNLDDIVVVSKNAANVGGSDIGLKEKQTVTVEDLLYGMLLESGNDCAVALAEYVTGGSEEKFCALMNEKAKQLGAYNTNYTNPHGLDTEENFSTAEDLAKIALELLNYPKLVEIVGTKNATIKIGKEEVEISNTNALLGEAWCLGGKTGYTDLANRCLVTYGRKDNMEIVTIVLGSESTEMRFDENEKISEYVLDTYSLVDISEYMNWYVTIPIYKGNILEYTRYIKENMIVPLKAGELEEIYVKQTILPIINPPLYKGASLGDIAMYIGKEKIYSTEIILDMDITKNTIIDYVIMAIKNMFSLKFWM